MINNIIELREDVDQAALRLMNDAIFLLKRQTSSPIVPEWLINKTMEDLKKGLKQFQLENKDYNLVNIHLKNFKINKTAGYMSFDVSAGEGYDK